MADKTEQIISIEGRRFCRLPRRPALVFIVDAEDPSRTDEAIALAKSAAKASRRTAVFAAGEAEDESFFSLPRPKKQAPPAVVLRLTGKEDEAAIVLGAAMAGKARTELTFRDEETARRVGASLSGIKPWATGGSTEFSTSGLAATVEVTYFDEAYLEETTMLVAGIAAEEECRISVPLAYPPAFTDETLAGVAAKYAPVGRGATERTKNYYPLTEGTRCLFAVAGGKASAEAFVTSGALGGIEKHGST